MLAVAVGCSTIGTLELAKSAGMPPLPTLRLPPSYLTPYSQRYRVAVLSFIDQTGNAGFVAEPVADVLTTALYATNRFNLYDRGDLRLGEAARGGRTVALVTEEMATQGGGQTIVNVQRDTPTLIGIAPDSDDPARQYEKVRRRVDGVLQGYVTAITATSGSGNFEIDYRIVNPETNQVVAGGSASIGFAANSEQDSVRITRADVNQLAFEISETFIDLAEMSHRAASVTDVEPDDSGAKLILNVGSAENIKQGFAGFVIEEDRRTRTERYLAKFVVVNVFPEAVVAVVIPHCNDSRTQKTCDDTVVNPLDQIRNVRIGSMVRFK